VSALRVVDYLTGASLDGEPSPELVQASCAVLPSGAVNAYRDAAGVWHHVPDGQAEHYRTQLREDVRAIYIET